MAATVMVTGAAQAQSENKNLVFNPGFEDWGGTMLPSGWRVGEKHEDGSNAPGDPSAIAQAFDAYDGAYALQLGVQGEWPPEMGYGIVAQDVFPIEPGRPYEFSFFAQGDNPQGGFSARAYVWWLGPDGDYLSSSDGDSGSLEPGEAGIELVLSPTGSYEPVGPGSGNAPPGTAGARIQIGLYSWGYLLIDNVTLMPVGAVFPPEEPVEATAAIEPPPEPTLACPPPPCEPPAELRCTTEDGCGDGCGLECIEVVPPEPTLACPPPPCEPPAELRCTTDDGCGDGCGLECVEVVPLETVETEIPAPVTESVEPVEETAVPETAAEPEMAPAEETPTPPEMIAEPATAEAGAAGATGGNLVLNPSFENWQSDVMPADWAGGTKHEADDSSGDLRAISRSEDAVSGSYALQLGDMPRTPGSNLVGIVRQDVAGVKAGASYTFQMYAKGSNRNDTLTARAYVWWLDGAGQYLSADPIVITIPSAAEYQLLSAEGVAPEGAAGARIQIGKYSWGYIVVDDVLLTPSTSFETPTPVPTEDTSETSDSWTPSTMDWDPVQWGTEQAGNGSQIAFDYPFSSAPVVLTSAQVNGKALLSSAANVTPRGFAVYVSSVDGTAINAAALLQWIAFIPNPEAGLFGGYMVADSGNRIVKLPPISDRNVLITNGRLGSQPVRSVAVQEGEVDVSSLRATHEGEPSHGGSAVAPGVRYAVVMIDSGGQPVINGTIVWMAVYPSPLNGFIGATEWAVDGQSVALVSTSSRNRVPPVLVSAASAQVFPSDEPTAYAAAATAVDNQAFVLSVLESGEQSVDNAWVSWVGYRGAVKFTPLLGVQFMERLKEKYPPEYGDLIDAMKDAYVANNTERLAALAEQMLARASRKKGQENSIQGWIDADSCAFFRCCLKSTLANIFTGSTRNCCNFCTVCHWQWGVWGPKIHCNNALELNCREPRPDRGEWGMCVPNHFLCEVTAADVIQIALFLGGGGCSPTTYGWGPSCNR